MERDLDILMLRQQVEEQPEQQQQQEQDQPRVWRNGEKPLKTLRQPKAPAPDISQSTVQNKKHTRDSINMRMGDRDMLAQVGGNPFLSNNNYINDIATRDRFLLARDSNFN